MLRSYNVIDADGHVCEPPDLWLKYTEPKFRDLAPRIVIDKDGKERTAVEGKIVGSPNGLATAAAVGLPAETIKNMKYLDGIKGAFDPHARILDLDKDGIDAAYLYPTLGLTSGSITAPDLAAAVCRAYNRWIADFCSYYPDRLFGVAMLPMQSPELAAEELRFARANLGLRAAFLRPNPYNDRLLSNPDYDVVWRAAQEMDVSIGIHEGNGGAPAAAVDRVVGFPARHIVSHAVEMMLASLNIIWGGVCERFPDVRFGFLECSGGWMSGWLDRMDRHFMRKGLLDEEYLKLKPSEYFKRQCWIAFEPPEGTMVQAADYLGLNKLLWATDYPHSDGWFPGAPETIAQKLPPEYRRQILAQGAIDFYKLS